MNFLFNWVSFSFRYVNFPGCRHLPPAYTPIHFSSQDALVHERSFPFSPSYPWTNGGIAPCLQGESWNGKADIHRVIAAELAQMPKI